MKTSARGVVGFLLYSPTTCGYVFRVYDPVNKARFEDYRLAAEDIEIEILSDDLVLIDGKLDYSRRVLGNETISD